MLFFLQLQESRGACSDLTLRMSRLGSCGKYPQNVERDLYKMLELPFATCLHVFDLELLREAL